MALVEDGRAATVFVPHSMRAKFLFFPSPARGLGPQPAIESSQPPWYKQNVQWDAAAEEHGV